MEHAENVAADLAVRVNELYWGSEASVNSLAQDLDLSKGALYDLIDPYPAGVPCPAGDGEMAYANRTARERGFVTCPGCGFEDEEERVMERLSATGEAPAIEPPATTSSRSSSVTDPGRGALVGSALVGAALGFAVANLVRRR